MRYFRASAAGNVTCSLLVTLATPYTTKELILVNEARRKSGKPGSRRLGRFARARLCVHGILANIAQYFRCSPRKPARLRLPGPRMAAPRAASNPANWAEISGAPSRTLANIAQYCERTVGALLSCWPLARHHVPKAPLPVSARAPRTAYPERRHARAFLEQLGDYESTAMPSTRRNWKYWLPTLNSTSSLSRSSVGTELVLASEALMICDAVSRS